MTKLANVTQAQAIMGPLTPMNRFASSRAMWISVLGGSVVGVLLLAITSRIFASGSIARTGIQHWLLLTAILIAVTSLVSAPFIRFLDAGWQYRLDEFKNRLRDGAIALYLVQFWERRLDDKPLARTDAKVAEDLLNQIYVSQYGRGAFAAPLILLLLVTFLSATLVAQTGIDSCVEHRCLPGGGIVAPNESRPQQDVSQGASARSTSGQSTALTERAMPAGRFAPLGDITLPKAAAAAIGGAFLFVVGDAVMRVRRRTTNIADIYSYTLRIVLAIPMGLAFTEIATASNLAVLVSFGLGAFPMDSLLGMFRRLTSKAIGQEERPQIPDQLVQLAGVTVPISTALTAEGIDSIDELIGVDPVLLSIRTGIPFPSILRFASQAVVRLHIGEKAKELEPLGLASSYMVAQLVSELDDQRRRGINPSSAEQRLLDATSRLKLDQEPNIPSKDTVEACFREIANHGYTEFLIAMG